MFFKLLLLFTLGPLLELYLLIVIGQRVGPALTILLVVSTGFFGVMLARAQGFFVLREIADCLRCGELPGDALMNGMLVLVGGAFLLTPGLISDTAGFLLLIPGSRQVIKRFILVRLKKALEAGTLHIFRR
ncbi:MAG: FxsA family protein [Dethiobacter sp.]|jgi:UPF0716 protein FxsA|nr:FxsA family protein [Dethiobacter sp.]